MGFIAMPNVSEKLYIGFGIILRKVLILRWKVITYK
jgi:hypothetical protein